MLRLITFLTLMLSASLARAGDIQQLLQLIDYLSVDYAGAVANGEVISPTEYEEMHDFAGAIARQVSDLPVSKVKSSLQQQAERLAQQVDTKVAPGDIRTQAAAMRLAIIDAYKVTVIPRQVPDRKQGAVLYANQCSGCHGVDGDGQGPQSADLEPPPVNFLDRERYEQRTLYGLYNTITQGVTGTAMKSYQALSAEDRWALAFYVGGLAAGDVTAAEAETLLGEPALDPLLKVQKLTVTTPAEASKDFGDAGGRLMAYLRTHPEALYDLKSPLQFSRHRLDDLVAAYRHGDGERAYQLAVDAYLGGFELVEDELSAVDADLRLDIEHAMTGLRNDIRKGISVAILEAEVIQIKGMFDNAEERLRDRSLSGVAAFSSAFFILVREGLEALLVVAALAAFLVKTGHRSNMRYLHYGWIGALALGFLTWLVSTSLIDISNASREITEGVAALVAAAVLFYVGFWLHDKSNAVQWKQFIENNVRRALSTGVLWGLTGLSFIAVYREVFETILFYQALWVQTDMAGKSMALSGFCAGIIVLIMLAWVMIRYSVHLPLRQFFSFTGVLMFVLAVVFAGKGVAALQEAGYIPVSPVHFPRIDLLGIYPNLQGLLLQLGLLLLALLLWYGLPWKRRAAV